MYYLVLHRFKENYPIILNFNHKSDAVIIGQQLQDEGEIDFYSLYDEMTSFEAKLIIRDFWGDQ